MGWKCGLIPSAIFLCLVTQACAQPAGPAPALTEAPSAVSPAQTLAETRRPSVACQAAGQSWTSPADGMTLLCVPAGEFLMGASEADAEATPDEKPQHRVYLDAFGIDRTEVTNAMFAKCVAAGACHERRYSPYLWGVASRTHPDYYASPVYASYPVIMLDGDEAAAYCRWAGRHLPSEAEWEKAARGTDSRPYPWGAAEPDCSRANFFGCAKDTVEAGALPGGASPYGALNMAGNVWEWTADWYAADYYAHSPERNPTGPASGQEHTLRGGGLTTLKNHLRVTSRVGGVYHWADGEAGFRCASSAAAP